MRAAALYGSIEQWWGADLDEALIPSIAHAPAKHLQAFADHLLEDPVQVDQEPVRPGSLRPIVTGDNLSLALRLLLYSHEVVVDWAHFGWPLLAHAEPPRGDELQRRLALLQSIRPLIEADILRFDAASSRGRHPASSTTWLAADTKSDEVRLLLATVQSTLREEWQEPGYIATLRDLQLAFTGMTGACQLASLGRGHTLATSQLERYVRDALLRAPKVDKRQALLSDLAALTAPDFMGKPDVLVRLRSSSEEFASWREHLGRALEFVEGVSDTDLSSRREAGSVVASELNSAMTALARSTSRSPSLTALQSGVAGFALTGIGSIAGYAASGNPLVALASGIAVKSVEAGAKYITAVKDRRKGMALLDVAVLFDPAGSKSAR